MRWATGTGAKRALALAATVAVALLTSGHVGSPDAVFEGAAGPYAVRVIVRAPGVVPGLADITVRILGGHESVSAVTVLPLRGGTPTAALPPADTARPIQGDATLFSAQLWLMSGGSYSVAVRVAGSRGEGEVNVPIVSVATRRLGMQTAERLALAALGIFLFVGALTIVGAAVREGGLPPGAEPDPARRRKARVATAVATVVLALGVMGGKSWWDSEDGSYLRRMYRTPSLETSVREVRGGRMLRIGFDTTRVRGWSPLIPDHGKLVHLFLIQTAGGNGFAHLHPYSEDSLSFESSLPPVPAGRYHVFADIVRESGYAETLVDTIELAADTTRPPEPRPNQGPAWPPRGSWWLPTDPDDAYHARRASARERDTLADGSVLTLVRGAEPLMAEQEARLEFTVMGANGDSLWLEPYMGMAGHAVVMKDDGSVYVHLHPVGTIAVASQLAFQLREPGDTILGRLGRRITALQANPAHMARDTLPGRVTFPYAFPKAGRYRVWVQVRRGSRVLTGAFETLVS